MDGNENQLTFGQVVPIFLLISTLVTFKEAYDGKRWIVGTHERSQPELISLSIGCSQGPERISQPTMTLSRPKKCRCLEALPMTMILSQC